MTSPLLLSSLFLMFLCFLPKDSASYSLYFKALSGYGQDNNSENSPSSKAFHQCGMEESCKFVMENILIMTFTKAKNEVELPKKKENHVVWQKQGLTQKDCKEISETESTVSGEYKIWVNQRAPISVYCDMKTDGGGWTVIQRRVDGSTDFNRGWEEYQRGFGDRNRDFWLGLDAIHAMTARNVILRIDLTDIYGKKVFAEYKKFRVGSEESNYKLEISEYSGNATDAMKMHNGMSFTTKDRDNDKFNYNCAVNWKGGWWYNDCLEAHLNGLFTIGLSSRNNAEYMSWNTLNFERGDIFSCEMKLRPTGL
eukprot:Seg5312.1 transcript_id=Seg5312.1/GoldUCD/mRNA.D3Y31 product=Ryncolin-2 protein_id=Seg5312.1/GoldUCD/D3Y31